MTEHRIFIIGNGGAAMSAAQAARLAGHGGEIHLVSIASGPAFNPMLSPYYFRGKVPWEGCFPFGEDFYREQEVTRHCCVPVGKLEAGRQLITMTDGREFSYDRCLIATGAKPVLPPVPGLRESERALPLRSAGSARRLEDAMQTASRVLVLGASLVGIEMAEVLVKKGIDVVLVDVVDQILPRGMHPSVARILMQYLERQGVDVRLGCSMQRMEDSGDGVVCHFADGVTEKADFVVCSTGVRANIDFVDRDEVDVDLGILTDERMQTSVENLYAAGDAAQAFNRLTGRHDWLGTWGNACHQGRTAGQVMAGQEAFFPGSLPENISPLFDWSFAHIGEIQPGSGQVRHVASGEPEQEGFSLLAFSDGVLTGANLVNCTELAGKLHRAILRKRRSERVADSSGDDIAGGEAVAILKELTA